MLSYQLDVLSYIQVCRHPRDTSGKAPPISLVLSIFIEAFIPSISKLVNLLDVYQNLPCPITTLLNVNASAWCEKDAGCKHARSFFFNKTFSTVSKLITPDIVLLVL